MRESQTFDAYARICTTVAIVLIVLSASGCSTSDDAPTELPAFLREDAKTPHASVLRRGALARKQLQRSEDEFIRLASQISNSNKQKPPLDIARQLKDRDELLNALKELEKEGAWLLEQYPNAEAALERYRQSVATAIQRYEEAEKVYDEYQANSPANLRSQYEQLARGAAEAAMMMSERHSQLGEWQVRMQQDIETVEESMLLITRMMRFVELMPESEGQFVEEYLSRMETFMRRFQAALQRFDDFVDSFGGDDDTTVQPTQIT